MKMIAVEERDDSSLLQRHEVVLQVAPAVAFVRMRRVFPLRGADDVFRLGEAWLQGAIHPRRRTAKVIPVQVTGQRNLD
jgi:hypothetical protein